MCGFFLESSRDDKKDIITVLTGTDDHLVGIELHSYQSQHENNELLVGYVGKKMLERRFLFYTGPQC